MAASPTQQWAQWDPAIRREDPASAPKWWLLLASHGKAEVPHSSAKQVGLNFESLFYAEIILQLFFGNSVLLY